MEYLDGDRENHSIETDENKMINPSVKQPKNQVADYSRLPGSEWIEDHRKSLPDNEWAAADDSGLLATSPSIDSLMDELQAKHIDLEKVVIAFITSDSA